MNVRLVVCLGILIGFMEVVRSGLYAALDAYGFWPYMVICAVSVSVIVCAAFGWDYYEARQRPPSQEVLPPQPPLYPPSRQRPRYPSES